MNRTKTCGIAYGIVKCVDPRKKSAVLARFKEALDNVRLADQDHLQADFSVFQIDDGKMSIRLDGAANLIPSVEALEHQGANFIIRSILPQAESKTAAKHLADVVTMVYAHTELFMAVKEGKCDIMMNFFYEDEEGRPATYPESDSTYFIKKYDTDN